jgi:diguanylate cyclase (GGDEF)-like protein
VAFIGGGTEVSTIAIVAFTALVLVGFSYLSRREAEFIVGVLVLGYAVVVATARGFSDPLMSWLTVVAMLCFVGLFTSRLVRRLARLAYVDELTTLPNRRYLLATLRREMAGSLRDGTPLSVAMVDLDGFKAVNDTQGHVAGDRLLAKLGSLWAKALRANDFIGRYGGDEFVVICPRCSQGEAERVVTRLIRSTSKEISASWGCAEWDFQESLEAFIGRCDQVLYTAKINRESTVQHPLATSPHVVIDLTGETQRKRDTFLS